MSSILWYELADALLDLEMALRSAGLWSTESPRPEQLASTAPFCIDTLDFEQWLQWVFIPRMAQILAAGSPMPGRFQIAAMGEQAFAHLGQRQQPLLAALEQIDRLAAELG